MKIENELTVSVVLYNNAEEEIRVLLSCFESVELDYEIIIIDNSPTDSLKVVNTIPHVQYFFAEQNLGFGKAQNMAIQKILNKSKYHLILNPDIVFSKGTIENIYNFMEQHKDIGQVMPRIFYPNGEIQKLCKLLPAPIDLFGRRFFPNTSYIKKRNEKYELTGFQYDKLLDTPNLSGCFMFLRTSVLKEVNGFDTRYFMYLEDFDLTRRINKISRTVFYPGASVTHVFNKASYSNPTLLKHHIISAIKYFNKWGWFFDRNRKILNKRVLSQIN
jgi:GT2 family glycosyltransferase